MSHDSLRKVAVLLLLLVAALGAWFGLGRHHGSIPPTPASVQVVASAPPAGAQSSERLIVNLSDPAGDDKGPGSYVYPRDQSFLPGTFDLRRFQVSTDAAEVHFRLSFGAVPNPWGAPEGFGYQRIDVYLATGSGGGNLTAARPGANVRFVPPGWNLLLRIAPWRGSRLERADGRGGVERLPVEVCATKEGEATIHVQVPQKALGCPGKQWRYYVLVGGYDAFGPDDYRPVTAQGGRWVFGGGDDGNGDPNLLDLLAPRFGGGAQTRQLKAAQGAPATLRPVGR